MSLVQFLCHWNLDGKLFDYLTTFVAKLAAEFSSFARAELNIHCVSFMNRRKMINACTHIIRCLGMNVSCFSSSTLSFVNQNERNRIYIVVYIVWGDGSKFNAETTQRNGVDHNVSRFIVGKVFPFSLNPLINLITSDRNWQNKSQFRNNKVRAHQAIFLFALSILFINVMLLVNWESIFSLEGQRCAGSTDESLQNKSTGTSNSESFLLSNFIFINDSHTTLNDT